MPLVEVATIELGAAVAKSIFKFWLKDLAFDEDISSSLIDLLKAKTSDIFAQREGERQFAKIGDKIVEDLLPVFETEGTHLDEGDRIAVARAVAEAFNRSKLSSELFTKLNLEPTQLAQHIMASHPTATYLFSEAATSLYQRILKESCIYIVNIASQFPSFTENSFAEVLKREDQIIAIAKEALEELHKIREQLDPTVEAERFEIDYREAVARNLDFLHLIGAEVSLANRRHRLSVAYITLSVEQVLWLPLSPSFPSDQSSENTQDEKVQRIVAVDTALASSRHLLVRGLPGSGKTTLLQWVAVKAATRSFEGQLAGWNGYLPFYIQLRRCIRSGLPEPQDFPGLVSPAIADTMPEGWVYAILKSGRAIVLVDGVDEVPESQRKEVFTWLPDLMENFTKARFIITSRPHAVKEEEWWNHEGLSISDLQSMELASIYEFLEHWHEAVRQELRTDDEKNELGPLVEHLKERIRQVRALRTLATNPLLCAMLCALNRERRRKLPVNRIELYEACCSLLLYRREQESHISLPEYPDLDYGQKRRLLEDLAYWMIKEKLTETEVAVVDERFEQQLAHMPNIKRDTSGMNVRKFFVERSGIIREPVEDRIDFVHRTFQEFFAAKAALDAMEIEVLIANAHNDQWREVIILAAGLASKTMCEQLVYGLISRGDSEKHYSSQLYLLAVSCLETAIQLGPKVKSEVEKRLSQVIPPKNMTEAKILVSAGDLAVPYLTDEGNNRYNPAHIMAACIRALTLIGSEAALNAIEGYAKGGYLPTKVIEELCKGWDLFDKTTYAEHVVSPMLQKGITLRLAQIPSLDQLRYLRNLTSLTVTTCKPPSNLSHLANLAQLTKLDLASCEKLSDLDFLAELKQLKTLSLSYCNVKDLSPLQNLTQLESLRLSNCTAENLSPLANLPRLTKLELIYCSELNDLNFLESMTQLTYFYLIVNFQIKDLSPLIPLVQLKRLTLDFCYQLTDLSPLASLTQLAELELAGCQNLTDLSPLTNLTQLIRLDLSYCGNLRDLSILASLDKLRELRIIDAPSQIIVPKNLKAVAKLTIKPKEPRNKGT